MEHSWDRSRKADVCLLDIGYKECNSKFGQNNLATDETRIRRKRFMIQDME
jgi:hypothetical protein